MTRGRTLTIAQAIEFRTETCCNCGVLFAMTEDFYKARQREKEAGSFYCPNGHAQHYVGKSDEQKAKEAAAARREAELAMQAERDQRLAAERELRRHRQRAKGGACPVCNRTFVQVARHIKTQHPDFTP
jgi:DNA repair exonuclease SbcCD ATPase subunit